MPQPARLVGAESYGVLDGPWCMVHEPWPAWRGAGELGEQGAGGAGSWGAGELAHGARVLAPNSGTETLVKLPKTQESAPTGGRGDGFGLVSQK